MSNIEANMLLQFPQPPPSRNITVLEQDGLMTHVCADRMNVFSTVADYPEVSFQTEDVRLHTDKMDSAQMAFLSHEQTFWKRIMCSWNRAGFTGAMEEILESRDEVPSWASGISSALLKCLQKMTDLKETLYPQTGLSNEDMMKKFTSVSNWSKSPVQALAWHPHVTKLAVALKDDSVHVYGSATGVNPFLKHKLQKKVADLAWQPLSSSVLAVACQKCILIWHVEPTSLALRPSSSTVQVLEYPGHSPVTSLAWNPDSSHLVSASPRHASILVWDVPREICIPLKRGRGGGVSMLRYSPDSSKLFTGTTSPLFRVWETRTWHAEVWSQLSGHCSAACWSPDGTVLIFAMAGQSALYAVRYAEGVSQGDNISVVGTSVLLADVSPVTLLTTIGEEVRTGGEVRSIVWDKTGERVAVLFEGDEAGNNPLVAVFKSTVHPVLELLPGGFIKGRPGENVHHIAFQPSFTRGALLSVVWSSGRLGYIPMHFVPAQEIRQMGVPSLGPSSHYSPRQISRDRI